MQRDLQRTRNHFFPLDSKPRPLFSPASVEPEVQFKGSVPKAGLNYIPLALCLLLAKFSGCKELNEPTLLEAPFPLSALKDI